MKRFYAFRVRHRIFTPVGTEVGFSLVRKSPCSSSIRDTSAVAGWDASRSAAGDCSPWLIAIIVSIATFMVVLDAAIANVSLRYIAGSFGASIDQSTWIVTTYLIANTPT